MAAALRLKENQDIICYVASQSLKQNFQVGNVYFVDYIQANAKQVQSAGAGFMGELSDFNVEWIKEKLNEIETVKKTH